MGEDEDMSDRDKSRPALAWWGAALIVLAAALGLWTELHGVPFAVDTWWNDIVALPPETPVLSGSILLGELGGGWIAILAVPLGVMALLVLLRRRWWGAAFFAASSIASALLVQVLKQTFLRERPETILVLADEGSFPSGHTANAATIACALLILFPRWWVAVAGGAWVIAMAFSRTYISAHWPSDTLGGALIGTGVVLVLAAVFAGPLRREETARRSADRVEAASV